MWKYILMASLEQRFRAIQRENPNHSSLINFYRAIQNQDLSFSRRVFYFRKLVDKEDYAKEDYRKVRDSYCSKNATQKQVFFNRSGLETAQYCSV